MLNHEIPKPGQGIWPLCKSKQGGRQNRIRTVTVCQTGKKRSGTLSQAILTQTATAQAMEQKSKRGATQQKGDPMTPCPRTRQVVETAVRLKPTLIHTIPNWATHPPRSSL